jgi:PAS domain S-box-containing protein
VTFDVDWYATVIDALPDGMIVCDASGHPLLANQRALELLGMTLAQVRREEPVDAAWYALNADGTRRPFEDLPVERALRQGAPVRQDLHGIHRVDGSVVWVTADVVLVRDRHPDIGVVATFRDTTELHLGHNVDLALLRTAARLVERPVDGTSVIADHLTDLAAMCDAGRVLFVAIEHESGRARVTHEWTPASEHAPRSGQGVALDLVPRLLGRLSRREVVLLDPDSDDVVGGVRQLLAAWGLASALAAPVLTAGALESFVVVGWARPGEPDRRIVDGMAVAAELLAARLELERVHRDLRDLTVTLDDRVRERSIELVDEKERIAALLDAIPDLMFEIDAAGNFVNVHAPDESMLIMPTEDFVGRSSSEVMDMAIDADLTRMVNDRLRTNPSEVDVIEYTTDIYEGGPRSFECRIVHRTTGGRVVVVRDITGQAERARLLREHSARLSRANEDLERAVRAKDEFLAGIGHELRTPLSAILGLTEILLDDEVVPLSPPQQSAVETIRASGAHLLSLINDLLDLDQITNRMATLELDEVDLADVARLALDLVRTTADKGDVRLELDEGVGVPSIQGDRRRLGQVLLNLLENAVKFTPAGGSVGIDLWRRDPATAVCTVWDTGIGLDPRDHRRVFEPFVQVDAGLDRRYVGSGLGLTLAERFVRLHGGTIELSSVLGAGARFSVVLPIAGPTPIGVPPAAGEG